MENSVGLHLSGIMESGTADDGMSEFPYIAGHLAKIMQGNERKYYTSGNSKSGILENGRISENGISENGIAKAGSRIAAKMKGSKRYLDG